MATLRENPAWRQGWEAYSQYFDKGRPSALLKRLANPFDYQTNRASFEAYSAGWVACMHKLNRDY
jgi:hypothetical protein